MPQLVAAPPKAPPADPVPVAPDQEIVVTARRAPGPRDELSKDRIATYGARSIVVNGHRIGSLADLEQLPPEALASIQLYPPTEGKRFGFPPINRLLNVTMRRRFATLGLDLEGGGRTYVGARSTRFALRGVGLAGDRQINGSLSVRAATGLLAPDRPNDPAAPGGQSLIPRSR